MHRKLVIVYDIDDLWAQNVRFVYFFILET